MKINMINKLMIYQTQLKVLLSKIKEKEEFKSLNENANALQKSLQNWDEKMIQRKSAAYDDGEKFPNKFTANYLYPINQTKSAIPTGNHGSKARYVELQEEWKKLGSEGKSL